MTYQRNISRPRSEQVLDEEVEDRVEGTEIDGRDRDEEDGDGRGLDEGVAVRPLDALELRPAGDDEADDAAALALRGGGLRLLPALGRLLGAPFALALLLLAGPAGDLVGRLVDLGGPPDVGSRGRGGLGGLRLDGLLGARRV